jgi:hypothetical protein
MPESPTDDDSPPATATAGAAEASAPSRWRRVVKQGIRLASGLAVGLVIAEIAFYSRDGGAFPHLNVYVEDADRGVRLRPGATEKISFSKNPITDVRINAEGYRGADWPPPAPDEVVVVGDSQVFGLGVQEGETFSAVLQTALGGKSLVRNLGVPTYGPREYNAALEKALTKRPAKTVIYTVNLANDLFEANRPNKDRHAVWDGWAVRKETAPLSVSSFPGRSFLYTKSHAFYALRRWLYERGPKVDDRGFASEGTWRDMGEAAKAAGREHDNAASENVQLAARHESEVTNATAGANAAEQALEDLVVAISYEDLGGAFSNDEDAAGMTKIGFYRAARHSSGDIVEVQNGESSRGIRVNAEQIRRGAALRQLIDKKARERAEASRRSVSLATERSSRRSSR